MKGLNKYFKAAFVFAFIGLALLISLCVFGILPVYELVGLDEQTADLRITELQVRIGWLSGLMYVAIILVILFSLLGAFSKKQKGHKKAHERDIQK